jgi:hypothetical protein
MPALISRLLTLLALVLMPFGMNMAAATPINPAPAAATTQHCNNHGGPTDKNAADQGVDCALACSMLMTAQAGVDDPGPTVRLPTTQLLEKRCTSIHPDTATPPPKLS